MSDERRTDLTVGRGSTLLAEQRFYDDTYLEGDDGLVLFILDAALVRGPSGRERLRVKRDVIEFNNLEALADAITDGGWVEGLAGDREWRPTAEQLLTHTEGET